MKKKLYISDERLWIEIARENTKVLFHDEAYTKMFKESKIINYHKNKMLDKFILRCIKKNPLQVFKFLKERKEYKMSANDYDMIMPFGEHKGKCICDIPSNYLKWAMENLDDEEIALACEEEYCFRERHNNHFWS